MNKTELKSKLNSIGRKVFVECFYDFQEYTSGRIPKEDCIERLMQKYSDKEESGCKICIGNAKLIFESGMEFKAIGLICDDWGQTKLSNATIDTAMAILQKCPEAGFTEVEECTQSPSEVAGGDWMQ